MWLSLGIGVGAGLIGIGLGKNIAEKLIIALGICLVSVSVGHL